MNVLTNGILIIILQHTYIKGNEITICTSLFIAALYTIAKRWKEPKSLSTNEWIENKYMAHMYNAISFGCKKGNPARQHGWNLGATY